MVDPHNRLTPLSPEFTLTFMDRQRFEALVEEALDGLPEFFQEKLQNLAVIVEDAPPPDVVEEFNDDRILGLYQGIPLPERSVWDDYPYPDVISIYQRNIEDATTSDEEIVEEVRLTVMHEIGHYFGMDEDDLYKLGL